MDWAMGWLDVRLHIFQRSYHMFSPIAGIEAIHRAAIEKKPDEAHDVNVDENVEGATDPSGDL